MSKEEMFFNLIKLLVNKFAEKQFVSYEIERFLEQVPMPDGSFEVRPTGVEEIKILFKSES